MGETKLQNTANRGGTDASLAGPSGNLAIAAKESSGGSSLATLKSLISNHQALLANIRRRNEVLENDNSRLERVLADLSQQDFAQPDVIGAHVVPAPVDTAAEKLRWVESYLHGTLAQTLWALDVRAARLQEQASDADRLLAGRVLEMTHAAYDQLRSLLERIRGRVED